jgi:hypothetical protein
MSWTSPFKTALFALALIGFSMPQADAIEIMGGTVPAVDLNVGLVSTVAVHRGGGHRGGGTHRPAHRPGGAHRPGHRPGVPGHRPSRPGHRPGHPSHRPGRPSHPAHRPGYRPGYRGGAVWVNRPSSYRWGPGGAVAAGAALGFVTAATAAAWAGAPPQAGLCWYYTDPSRRQGFWDVCP